MSGIAAAITEERISLFWQYLRAGMTIDEAWSQAVLDAGKQKQREARIAEIPKGSHEKTYELRAAETIDAEIAETINEKAKLYPFQTDPGNFRNSEGP